jgi:hypothetical protein
MTATRHLAGAVAGQSEFLGDLTISEALWSLAGSIAGTGSVVGDLVVVKPLAGVIAGQSVLVGDLTKTEALWALGGHQRSVDFHSSHDSSAAAAGSDCGSVGVQGLTVLNHSVVSDPARLREDWDISDHGEPRWGHLGTTNTR